MLIALAVFFYLCGVYAAKVVFASEHALFSTGVLSVDIYEGGKIPIAAKGVVVINVHLIEFERAVGKLVGVSGVV